MERHLDVLPSSRSLLGSFFQGEIGSTTAEEKNVLATVACASTICILELRSAGA